MQDAASISSTQRDLSLLRTALAIFLCTVVCVRRADAVTCAGDLNNDGDVTVDELIRGVQAALTGCDGATAAVLSACPGDLNGDRVVTLDEIIATINSGLNGCDAGATPTPTLETAVTPTPTPGSIAEGCPHTFTDKFPLGTACSYFGAFSAAASCPSDLEVLLASDGALVAVGLGSDPVVTLGAIAVSPTVATLTSYLVGTDPVPHPIEGIVELHEGGHALIVDPSGALPFNIGGPACSFDRYAGSFARFFGGQVAMAASGR